LLLSTEPVRQSRSVSIDHVLADIGDGAAAMSLNKSLDEVLLLDLATARLAALAL
jgi:hypothetical protein